MKIKFIIHISKIKIFIKINSILHTSKCTVNQIKPEIQYTFLMSNFGFFRI